MNRCFLFSALIISLLLSAVARADSPSLDQLRHNFAMAYMEPDSRMALAKYLYDKGNRLTAFYILEDARGRFNRGQFDEAFRRFFIDKEPFDNSEKAEAVLKEKLRSDPASVEDIIRLADIYISRDDWPKAKYLLRKAIQLSPDQFSEVAALVEVLRREGHTEVAEKTASEFFDKHPQSAEAYQRKINNVMQRKDREAAKPLLDEALRRYPQKGVFHFFMASLLQDANNLKEAEREFLKAADLDKESALIQGWVGRFFLKVKKDEGKALQYYLNAYFLDPHFYDTEYAESRIRGLNWEAGQKSLARLVREGRSLGELALHGNSVVAQMAIKAMSEKWQPAHTKALIQAMGHDDDNVRWAATATLMKHVDRSFDRDLEGLLKSPDLRKRGLSAYIAVRLWGRKGISAIKPWLNEEAQLLRYDAISSLVQEGGSEGREIVLRYLPKEKNPGLIRVLNSIAANPLVIPQQTPSTRDKRPGQGAGKDRATKDERKIPARNDADKCRDQCALDAWLCMDECEARISDREQLFQCVKACASRDEVCENNCKKKGDQSGPVAKDKGSDTVGATKEERKSPDSKKEEKCPKDKRTPEQECRDICELAVASCKIRCEYTRDRSEIGACKTSCESRLSLCVTDCINRKW